MGHNTINMTYYEGFARRAQRLFVRVEIFLELAVQTLLAKQMTAGSVRWLFREVKAY